MFVPNEATVTHVTEVLVILLVMLLPSMLSETVLPHESFAAETAEKLLVLIFTLQFQMTNQQIVVWKSP